ncbi:MAG: hypothetical protein LBO02_00240 [Holosporaceae bacterium]|jgi:hypothetical protein|nr:hypothetical protein [Holosporaceae bacterium]
MRINLGKILAISALSLAIQNNCLASSEDLASYKSSKGEYSRKSSREGSYVAGDMKDSGGDAASDKKSEENYYPFELSQTKIAAENVAGMRIKGNKVILLGFNNMCSVEDLPEDCDFSELDFFRQYPKLFSVELDGLFLTEAMLENLQKFLPSTLKSFLVRSCEIKKEYYELLADIFEKHKSLESVSVISPDLSGPESTRILESLKDHSEIRLLSITVGELTDVGEEYLASLISNSFRTLEGASLGWNKITGRDDSYRNITEAIRKAEKLNKLEFSVVSLSENDLGLIVEAIGDLKNLRSLKIFFGNIGAHNHIRLFENVEIFQKSLANLSKLEALDISSAGFPSDVMQLIAQSISYMKNLKTLNISGNPLDEKSARSFSDAIKETDSITTLMANDCEMDAMAFEALCKSLANTSLMHLYFRGNSIKDGAKSLPVSSMPELLVVDFSKNEMSYDDAMSFIELTKDSIKLHIVNFKNNTGIESMSSIERTIKNDQLVGWKIKNYTNGHQVSFFGL